MRPADGVAPLRDRECPQPPAPPRGVTCQEVRTCHLKAATLLLARHIGTEHDAIVRAASTRSGTGCLTIRYHIRCLDGDHDRQPTYGGWLLYLKNLKRRWIGLFNLTQLIECLLLSRR